MKTSLNTKVTSFIAAVIILSGAISSTIFTIGQREGIEREYVARGKALADALARIINEGLAREDLDLIKQAGDIVHTSDVGLVQAFNPLWLGVSAAPESQLNLPPREEAIAHFKTLSKANHDHFILKEGSWLDIYHPVFLDPKDERVPDIFVGFVRLKISTSSADARLKGLIGLNLLISTVFALTAILIISNYIKKKLLRPIMYLHDSARRFRVGEIPAEVPIFSRDEVGDLTVEFNAMSQSLAEKDKQIRLQLEELERKNAELERFTYTVSHDLKSPIITIKGFIGSILNDAKAGNFSRMEQDISRISRAADRMKDLLDDLLELSRIGRMVNPSVEFSLTTAVKDAAEILHALIAQKGIKLVVTPDMPSVFADKKRIVEAIQNLIENSIKYMGDQPEPKIEIGYLTDRGQEPVYYVRDNGIGIMPEFLDKIFGLFDKLDPASEGTGIGLAIVKRIIHLHGGTVWAESDGPGRGASFFFTLPRIINEKGGENGRRGA